MPVCGVATTKLRCKYNDQYQEGTSCILCRQERRTNTIAQESRRVGRRRTPRSLQYAGSGAEGFGIATATTTEKKAAVGVIGQAEGEGQGKGGRQGKGQGQGKNRVASASRRGSFVANVRALQCEELLYMVFSVFVNYFLQLLGHMGLLHFRSRYTPSLRGLLSELSAEVRTAQTVSVSIFE